MCLCERSEAIQNLVCFATLAKTKIYNFKTFQLIMLDIKFIRENKDLIIAGAQKKHIKFDPSELIKVDDRRKELLTAIEAKRAEQNDVSNRLPQLKDAGQKAELISEMKILKENLQKEEEYLKEVMKEWQTLMLTSSKYSRCFCSRWK